MTKTDALEALDAGYKITHKTFLNDEYIYLDKYTFELKNQDDIILDSVDFWVHRSTEVFQNDWHFYLREDNNITKKYINWSEFWRGVEKGCLIGMMVFSLYYIIIGLAEILSK